MDLTSLATPFRERYVDYETLTAQLRAWAEAFPEIAQLRSLGATPEGRELWLLVLGRDPDRARPAVWIDANMHASEVCGTSVALAIAEDVLALQLDVAGRGAFAAMPPHVRESLRETLFYVMPRMSPDGAEAVLRTGRWVRSTPRDERPNREAPRWIAGDVDGDGLALQMRVPHPAGEFVESAIAKGVMVPRRIDDPPPYYRLFPEGSVEHFDGHALPMPGLVTDNFPDLNRNFPYRWASDPDQMGAGAYPGSEPESRAVIDFAARHPNIFVWLNLHTFGGCFIRPPGHVRDTEMDAMDLAVYRQVGEWAEALTGYPMVSSFEEFLYEPTKPLYGALSEYAYEERGAVAFVCELWDLFARLGLPRPKRFVDFYTSFDGESIAKLAAFDREHNEGRIFRPWRAFRHPQLGDVEVGGIDRRVGLFNPPLAEIAGTCERMSAFMARASSIVPRVVIASLDAERAGEDRWEVTASVDNRGYLPTYGVRASQKRPWNEALVAALECEGGARVEPATPARATLGHLEGWGSGLGAFERAPLFAMSRGSQSSRALRWLVRGAGRVTLRLGSCRVGFVERSVELG